MTPRTVTLDPVEGVTAEPPVIRITPSRGWVPLKLGELWQYRELMYFLAWRDVKVRYKQTVLGVAWAVIQPLLTMVVFSVFFGRLAKMPSDGLPYPLFSFVALVPWTFFANGLSQSANSLVVGARLITKVYFPRLVMPLSTILSGLIDFGLACLVLIGMVAYYGVRPSLWLLLGVPLVVALLCITALGVGLWLSALNVQFRDVRYVVPFVTQFWLFASPIAYPSSLLTEPWRTLYGVNPMAGVVEGFRWTLLGTPAPPLGMIVVSTVVGVAVMVSGAFYFRRMEKTFADVV